MFSIIVSSLSVYKVVTEHMPRNMGLVARKPVFGVSDIASFKPVSTATETSYKTEIPLVASLNMVLSKTRITKALIRLRGCAGWSAPVLFANPRKQVFSRRGPYGISLLQETSFSSDVLPLVDFVSIFIDTSKITFHLIYLRCLHCSVYKK